MRFAPLPCLRVAALLGLFCVVGCGKPADAVVSGKVTHQGKTLAFGIVVLFGEDNQPNQGSIAPDGAYTITGVPYGTAKFAVFSAEPSKRAAVERDLAPEIKERFKDKIKEPPLRRALDTSKWFPIPDTYNNPETSGLSVRIDKSETKFDIDLP